MNTHPSSIIAATDLSQPASYAVRRAALLVTELGARLRLLHSTDEGDWLERWAVGSHAPISRELWRESTVAALAQACDGLSAKYKMPVDAEVVDEPLVTALDRLAQGSELAMVVIGAHGRRGVRESLLGSTADRLLRAGRLPVLLVRNEPRARYARVALGTDFSDASRLAAMLGMALTPGADHYLLHAYRLPLDRDLAFASRSAETLELYRSEVQSEAARDLASFAHALGPAGRGITRAPREGATAEVLRGFVEEMGIDLLVLGARPRARWEANLLGSTALFAVTGLPCDVLLVPHAPAGPL